MARSIVLGEISACLTRRGTRSYGEGSIYSQNPTNEGDVVSDWFKTEGEAAPPAKPKVGLLRIIIFAMIAFWLFAKFFKPKAEVEGPAIPERGQVQTQPQAPGDRQPGASQLPSRDWHIDDVAGSGSKSTSKQVPETPRPTTGPRRSTETRTTDSDWSIEEVESKPTSKPGDNETRFDPTGGARQKNAPQNGKPKKTTEGDWSIEEVESKK